MLSAGSVRVRNEDKRWMSFSKSGTEQYGVICYRTAHHHKGQSERAHVSIHAIMENSPEDARSRRVSRRADFQTRASNGKLDSPAAVKRIS